MGARTVIPLAAAAKLGETRITVCVGIVPHMRAQLRGQFIAVAAHYIHVLIH